jgi:hypothetical protein
MDAPSKCSNQRGLVSISNPSGILQCGSES